MSKKITISISISPTIQHHLKSVGNKSRYIEKLLFNDLYQHEEKKIDQQIAEQIIDKGLLDEHIEELITPIANKAVSQSIKEYQSNYQ